MADKVYLGVGSNLGNRANFLLKAKSILSKFPQTRFIRSSSVIETDPVGGPPQGKYLNAVWELQTSLSPREFKDKLREIEDQLGRKHSEVANAPREIDLDILFFGNKIVDEEQLKIPHPRLQERLFVLEPLAEIAPDLKHPVLKKTTKELLLEASKTK